MSQKRLFAFEFEKAKTKRQNIEEDSTNSDSLNVDKDAGPLQKKQRVKRFQNSWVSEIS